MTPRFRRLLLGLVALSLLLVPSSPKADADITDEGFVGIVTASQVFASCPINPPDLNTLSHTRCNDGAFQNAGIGFVARRSTRDVICQALPFATGDVNFSARQNLIEGRGFITGSDPIGATGVDNNGTDVTCTVNVTDGAFHRFGTLAKGRVRVRVDVNGVFFHHYCLRFVASAVPTVAAGTIVTALAEGRAEVNGTCPADNFPNNPLDLLHLRIRDILQPPNDPWPFPLEDATHG